MAQRYDLAVDTLGQSVAGEVWITLRAACSGGVSLGGDASISPGETKRVPKVLGDRLVRNGKASYAFPQAKTAVSPEQESHSTTAESAAGGNDSTGQQPPTAMTATAAPIVTKPKSKRGK